MYVDPSTPGRERPDLFLDLLGQPSTEKQQQLENQASLILGWLCDRSEALGRALAARFLDDHPAVAEAARIGARTQVELPRPEGGKLRPDLSIEGSEQAFQLLVEVKTTASFAQHVHDSGEITLQDETYRTLWKPFDRHQARVRAVGTLTAKADPVTQGLPDHVDLAALRARDLSWTQLHDLISEIDRAGKLEPAVHAATLSFQRSIKTHLALIPLDHEALPGVLECAAPLVETISTQLASQLGAEVKGAKGGADFINRYVRYRAPDGRQVVLRVIASPAGGVLTPKGEGHSLVIAVGRTENGLLYHADQAHAASAGFTTGKTAKHTLTYRRWDLEAAKGQSAHKVAAEVVAALRRAHLV